MKSKQSAMSQYRRAVKIYEGIAQRKFIGSAYAMFEIGERMRQSATKILRRVK